MPDTDTRNLEAAYDMASLEMEDGRLRAEERLSELEGIVRDGDVDEADNLGYADLEHVAATVAILKRWL